MTDIAGVGSASAGLFRVAAQNQEQQQVQTQQAQQDQDGRSIAERRIEGAQQGAAGGGRQGAQQLDFSADDAQQAQVDARVDGNLEREFEIQDSVSEQSRRSEQAVEVTLSDAARNAQQQAVRIASQDVNFAQQSLQDGVAQTEAGLDSDNFTRIIDQNREREDASQGESRAGRELGRVIDTFA